jgi:hypothetical protein
VTNVVTAPSRPSGDTRARLGVPGTFTSPRTRSRASSSLTVDSFSSPPPRWTHSPAPAA